MGKTGLALGASVLVMLFAGAVAVAQTPPASERMGQAADRLQRGALDERMRRVRLGTAGVGGTMLLRAADVNQDGVATRAEIDALQQQEFAWHDRNGDGALDEADKGPMAQRLAELRGERRDDPWAAPRGRLDADGDDRLTLAELSTRTDTIFERLDANGDAQITADEARQAQPARRERVSGPDVRP